MSRYEILKYSGCIGRLLFTFAVIICSAFGIITVNKINIKLIQMIVGIISSACFFVSITIVFKDVCLLFKILFKKYKIENKRLKAIESRRPFDTISANNKILVFKNKRISVEESFAKGLSIGDLITLVFADKVQYPIIIVKREAHINGSTK